MPRNRTFKSLASLLVALIGALVVYLSKGDTDSFSGMVVGVHDGDTLSVMRGGQAVKIRLFGIDCPELHQAYGQKAKQLASGLVFDKRVWVEVRDRDRYGHLVGEVYVAEDD